MIFSLLCQVAEVKSGADIIRLDIDLIAKYNNGTVYTKSVEDNLNYSEPYPTSVSDDEKRSDGSSKVADNITSIKTDLKTQSGDSDLGPVRVSYSIS